MNDERLQHQISLLLRIGISISGVLLALGLILTIATGSELPSLQSGWHIFSDIFAEQGFAGLINPVFLLFSGIIVLMLTPIFRVIITIAGFAFEKDTRYVIVSSVVLLVIFISIAFSIVH